MGIMDVLTPVATGINYGTVAAEVKRLEDSVHAGGNAYLTAVLQLTQAQCALQVADLAFQTAELDAIPFPARFIVYLTPVALAIATKIGIEDDTLRLIAIFAQDHFWKRPSRFSYFNYTWDQSFRPNGCSPAVCKALSS